MNLDWGTIVAILTGFTGLAGTAYAVIRAIKLTPGEVRSADAATAKSYAEAARIAADQASQITQRNGALEAALRETNKTVDDQGKQIAHLVEQQTLNITRIDALENENTSLYNQLGQLREENEQLRKALSEVQEENRKLKAQYLKKPGRTN